MVPASHGAWKKGPPPTDEKVHASKPYKCEPSEESTGFGLSAVERAACALFAKSPKGAKLVCNWVERMQRQQTTARTQRSDHGSDVASGALCHQCVVPVSETMRLAGVASELLALLSASGASTAAYVAEQHEEVAIDPEASAALWSGLCFARMQGGDSHDGAW